jgi:hypothetical protein
MTSSTPTDSITRTISHKTTAVVADAAAAAITASAVDKHCQDHNTRSDGCMTRNATSVASKAAGQHVTHVKSATTRSSASRRTSRRTTLTTTMTFSLLPIKALNLARRQTTTTIVMTILTRSSSMNSSTLLLAGPLTDKRSLSTSTTQQQHTQSLGSTRTRQELRRRRHICSTSITSIEQNVFKVSCLTQARPESLLQERLKSWHSNGSSCWPQSISPLQVAIGLDLETIQSVIQLATYRSQRRLA